MRLSESVCRDAVCSKAQKEGRGPQGQMIPEREKSVSFLPIIFRTANISWSVNSFPKGISKKGRIG